MSSKVCRVFFQILVFLACTNQVWASSEPRYIACLECNASKALDMAKYDGTRSAGGVFVSREYVLFDPVSEFIKTVRYEKSYEAEIGRYYEITYEIPTSDADIQALSLYNSFLDKMYVLFGGENAPNTVLITSIDSAISASQASIAGGVQSYEKQTNSSTLTDKQWIYNVVKGTTLVPLPFESYAWMTRSYENNALKVSHELAKLMQLSNPANTISLAIELRLKKFLAELPLQFTVAFQNGDTVTFILDCVICSINYLPLYETAADKNGKKLNSVSRTGAGAGVGDSGYGDFYSTMENLGAVLTRHCSTVYTGVSGNTSAQSVCFFVYN